METCTHRVLIEALHDHLVLALTEHSQIFAKRLCPTVTAPIVQARHWLRLRIWQCAIFSFPPVPLFMAAKLVWFPHSIIAMQ